MTNDGLDAVELEALKHPFASLGGTPREWRAIFNEALGAFSG
jgi:hypothetical protein